MPPREDRHAGMEGPSYALVCNVCGRRHHDDGAYLLSCCDGGLLEAEYPPLRVRDDLEGMWRFVDWLPVHRPGSAAVGGVTVPAPALGAALGLDDLWVSVNGWWPEGGAHCPTCSFKDLEVAPTLQRLVEAGAEGVVVATAGNTGRAFADLGGDVGFPVVVVAAERHVERIWRAGRDRAPTTTVVGIAGGDYNDAIEVAGAVAAALGFEVEGGVRNVARRDGIGSLLLDAVTTIGRIPDHYVQAVGGGPGPIGVWGMARRLADDGRWGTVRPRFHLAQNDVHAPVHVAWQARREQLGGDHVPPTDVDAFADVLVNRAPAYGVRGGLHDLLVDTDGQTYAVPAAEAAHWREVAASALGVDVMEAPAVATAALARAVAAGEVARGDCVLLAVTGAGVDHLDASRPLRGPGAVPLVAKDDAVTAIAGLVGRGA